MKSLLKASIWKIRFEVVQESLRCNCNSCKIQTLPPGSIPVPFKSVGGTIRDSTDFFLPMPLTRLTVGRNLKCSRIFSKRKRKTDRAFSSKNNFVNFEHRSVPIPDSNELSRIKTIAAC